MTHSPIILAVDTPDFDIARRWVEATRESVGVFKFGLEFFLSFGGDGLRRIKSEYEIDIFLDLKLHDIPNTVGSAAKTLTSLAPRFLTVHASGGGRMISAAVEALPDVDITAVTILTSLSGEELREIGFSSGSTQSAVALAGLSVNAGARAVVSSPLEISAIREVIQDRAKIITPGVRPASALTSRNDDQVRVMTPRSAIEAGADYLVIGRPITQHWERGSAAMSNAAAGILEEISS